MATTFSNLLYHIIFTTKNRIPLIHDDLREPLYEYIGGIIRGEGGTLLEIGGVSDHIHLLARFKTDIAVSTMLQKIKGKSSKWVNERPDRREFFDWQDGYAAFSASESVVERIRKYIRNQEEHHKRVPFKDELIALLKKNKIAYDERYLLG